MERVNIAVIQNCGSPSGTSVFVFKELSDLHENVGKIIYAILENFKKTDQPFEVEDSATERINCIVELINEDKYEESIALYNNFEDDSLIMAEYTDTWIDLYLDYPIL